jgi:hypothetical protein
MLTFQTLHSLKRRGALTVFAIFICSFLQSQIYLAEGATIYANDETIVYSGSDSGSETYDVTENVTDDFHSANKSGIAVVKKQQNKTKVKTLVTKEEHIKRTQKLAELTYAKNIIYKLSCSKSDKSFEESNGFTSSVVPVQVFKLKYILQLITQFQPSVDKAADSLFYITYSEILFAGFKGSFSVRPPPFS